jgi:hypothetical protein
MENKPCGDPMLTFTILLGDRSADRPELSLAEASEMASIGFRFAEFRPETGKFRLSPAYRTLHNLDRGTLTFMAEPGERHASVSRREPAPPGGDAFELRPAATR